MNRKLFIAVVSIFAAASLVATGAPGLAQEAKGPEPVTKMQAGEEVVEQVNVIEEMIGHIDWENKVVYAVGDGVAPKDAISPAQARVRAKRAAIDEAYGRLLEAVKEIRVSAESLTRNFVNENRVVRTKVQGFVKHAEIEKLKHFEDGSFQVMMKMPLVGAKGVSAAIFPVHEQRVRMVRTAYEVSRGSSGSTTGKTGQRIDITIRTGSPTYTGLIVDAKGFGTKPVLYPRIITEDGKSLYDVTVANPNATLDEGLVEYRKSLGKAKSIPRLGSNPLVVKASGVKGKYGADLVVSAEDAKKIYEANLRGKFLEDANVAVVID